jgi:hypothetical protein
VNAISSEFFLHRQVGISGSRLLIGWLKGKLQQRQLTDPDQLFDAVNEILTALSVDIIEDVFRN